MLRRQEAASLTFRPSRLTGKGWVTFNVNSRRSVTLTRLHKDQWAAAQEQQRAWPAFLAEIDAKSYWQFNDFFYSDNERLDANAVHALLVTRAQRQQQRIQRAQQTVAMGYTPRESVTRQGIPDDVKHLVWSRDGGRCRHCASATELQFDHVIPLAMGGSSTPENLQILCGPCNRRKGASITIA